MTFDQLAIRVLEIALESTVRAGALVALAALVLRLVRPRRAASSLAIWTFVLAVACALPVIEAVAPRLWTLPIVTSVAPEASATPVVLPREAFLTPAASMPVLSQLGSDRLESSTSVVVSEPVSNAPSPRAAARWIPFATLLYGGVSGVLIAQLIVGWRATRSLRLHSSSIEDEDAVRLAVARVVPTGRVPRCPIVQADGVVVPIAVGHFRPAVVLPSSWRTWSPHALGAVLAHELSHVRRGDAWRQLIALVYRAIFWFSPIAWILHRVVIELTERASDEEVLEVGFDQAQYAELLIAFFAHASARRVRAAWSLAMARGRGAERRIAGVLAWTRRTERAGWVRPGLVLALLLATGAVLAAATPVLTGVELAAPGALWFGRSAAIASKAVPAFVEPQTTSSPPLDVRTLTLLGRVSSEPDTPVGGADFSDSRRVMFLFDTAHLTDDGLTRAKGLASSYSDAMRTRTSVGIEMVHLWSVVALGQPAPPITFTRDTNDTFRALSALQRPATAVPSAKAVEALCGVFSITVATPADFEQDQAPFRAIGFTRERPSIDSKLIVLFSDAPDALTAGSESVTTAATACEQAGVKLLTVTSLGLRWIPPPSTAAPPTLQNPVMPIAAQTPLTRDISLVFDLREARGDALAMDLEQAMLLLQTMTDRIQMGVDIEHSFQIATLGDRVDVVSPPGLSAAQLRAILYGLRTSPPADVTPAARDRALVQYCQDLGRSGTGTVVYFGAPRLRFLSDAAGMQLAMPIGACGQAHVNVFLGPTTLSSQLSLVARARMAPPVPITVVDRTSTPVTITSRDSALQSGYVTAILHNESTKAVRSVTLKAVLKGPDGTPASRAFLRAGPETLIAPGASAEIASQLVDMDVLREAKDNLHAEVSVIEVDFADGSAWRVAQ